MYKCSKYCDTVKVKRMIKTSDDIQRKIVDILWLLTVLVETSGFLVESHDKA